MEYITQCPIVLGEAAVLWYSSIVMSFVATILLYRILGGHHRALLHFNGRKIISEQDVTHSHHLPLMDDILLNELTR